MVTTVTSVCRFEYQPKKDTAEGIAQELLGTGLICQEDVHPMASHLNQLINNPPASRVLTFRVSTGFGQVSGFCEFFGRNVFGQFLIIKLLTKFHAKTKHNLFLKSKD
jgi:hypothetical protein